MADGSWMRLLGGQRSRLPTRPNSPNPDFSSTLQPPGSTYGAYLETTDALNVPHTKTIPRLSSWHGLNRGASSSIGATSALNLSMGDPKTGDGEGEPRVKETERVWHNPSVDQMAEALQTALMTRPTIEALPREYNAFVLHLIEGYGASKKTISDAKRQLSEAEAQQQKESDEFASRTRGWTSLEAQYKAEIKRLELLIHRTSHNGLEAVVMARSGSLLKKGAQGRSRAGGHSGAHSVDPSVAGAGTSSRLDGGAAASESGQTGNHRGSILMRPRILNPDYDVEWSEKIRGKSSVGYGEASHLRRHDSSSPKTAPELPTHSSTSSSSSSDESPSRLETRQSAGEGSCNDPGSKVELQRGQESFALASENVSPAPGPVTTAKRDPASQAQHRRDFSFAAGDDGLSMRSGGAGRDMSVGIKAGDAGRGISRPPVRSQRGTRCDDRRSRKLVATDGDDATNNSSTRNRNNNSNKQQRHQAAVARDGFTMLQQPTEAEIAAVRASALISSGEGAATDTVASQDE